MRELLTMIQSCDIIDAWLSDETVPDLTRKLAVRRIKLEAYRKLQDKEGESAAAEQVRQCLLLLNQAEQQQLNNTGIVNG